MSDLIAKQIVKNQYWVVTDGNKKVGNVVAENDGYGVKLNGSSFHFNSTDDIYKNTKIVFENQSLSNSPTNKPYPEYPTPDIVFNSVMDVRRKLHLFTKSADSKCYHVAGWFITKHTGVDKIMFCPKYIFIQRYSYQGPFKSEADAIKTLNK